MKLIKLLLTVILSAIFVFASFPVAAEASQNTWDPDNEVYDISTEADLLAFRDTLNTANQNEKYYYENVTVNLLQDITMTQTYVSPDSNGDAEAQFCGTFNGNNHKISNLNMVSSDNYTVSLLPFLGNATIKDLTLENVTIENGYTWNSPFAPVSLGDDSIINCHLTGNCVVQAGADFSNNWNYTAGILADNYMGSLTVENCTVGENVVINGRGGSGKYRVAGGLVAYTRDKTVTLIKNCVNKANISSDYIAGGLVGTLQPSGKSTTYMNYAAIVDSYNYGNISSNEGTTGSNNIFAGIVAQSSNFSELVINRCANFGDVTVNTTSVSGCGGIAAEVRSATIINCFNAGNVTAVSSNSVGGIAGHTRTNTYGSPITGSVDVGEFYFPQQYNAITNCYNVGNIQTTNGDINNGPTGGIVGICQESDSQTNNSIIHNVYNFGTVSANEAAAGGTSPRVASIVADSDIMVNNSFAAEGTSAVPYLHDSYGNDSPYTCKLGYYDSADMGGKVYPADATSSQETKSDTALDTDLKQTLDKFVDEVNPEFEQTSGQKFRLLSWTYSDGSDGLGIHPVFGYDIENNDPESEKSANGGYLTTSKYGFEYYKFSTETNKTVTVTANPNKGKKLKSISATDRDGNNVALTDNGDGTYSFTMPEADVTVDAEWEDGEDDANNTVYLTTKDSVDINFVIDGDYYTDDPEAYVVLNYNHNQRTYQNDFYDEEIPLSEVEQTSDGRYKFTIQSAPAQLTETIKITLYDSKSNEPLYDVDYSMWDYCKDIIDRYISIEQNTSTDMYDAETEEQWKKASELCKALIDYATAAQVYFEYNTLDMASKRVSSEETYYSDDVTNEIYYHNIAGVTLDNIKNVHPVASVSGNFAVSHTSLMSLSNTEVRFYYDDEIDKSDYALSINIDNWYGSARPTAQFGQANSGTFISVGGIESANLDNPFTLQIKKLSTNETTTIKYNALAYCYTVIRDTSSSTNQKEKELASLLKAVFLYNRYADEYFESF